MRHASPPAARSGPTCTIGMARPLFLAVVRPYAPAWSGPPPGAIASRVPRTPSPSPADVRSLAFSEGARQGAHGTWRPSGQLTGGRSGRCDTRHGEMRSDGSGWAGVVSKPERGPRGVVWGRSPLVTAPRQDVCDADANYGRSGPAYPGSAVVTLARYALNRASGRRHRVCLGWIGRSACGIRTTTD